MCVSVVGGGEGQRNPGGGQNSREEEIWLLYSGSIRLGHPLYGSAYRVSDAASLLMCTIPKRPLSSNGHNSKAFISEATRRTMRVGCRWQRNTIVCKYRQTAPVSCRRVKGQTQITVGVVFALTFSGKCTPQGNVTIYAVSFLFDHKVKKERKKKKKSKLQNAFLRSD